MVRIDFFSEKKENDIRRECRSLTRTHLFKHYEYSHNKKGDFFCYIISTIKLVVPLHKIQFFR